MPWQVTERWEHAARLECELRPVPGYPFHLHMQATYALDERGLECTIAATNAGSQPAPYGLGQHPYVACPQDRADNARLCVPAAAVLENDAHMIPTGGVIDVTGTDLDFRHERTLGGTAIDHCYTALEADADGVVRATVSDGATWRTTVWMRPPFAWLMVFTGDALQPPRWRRAVAIEPMTCPPNAFQTGENLVILEPGASLSATWGVTPERLR
jgi:aldose 1-epimerase